MSAEENKAIVRRFVEAINDGNYGLLDELMTPAPFVCRPYTSEHFRARPLTHRGEE